MFGVDRNQLGRRNLTDEQRAVVVGRLYKVVKLAQGRPPLTKKSEKFSQFSGGGATAEVLAAEIGVSGRTVHNAAKFAEVVEALQEISPQAAQKVLQGEVKDALTVLPKVPVEALPHIAERIEQGSRSVRQALQEFRAQQLETPPLPARGRWLSCLQGLYKSGFLC